MFFLVRRHWQALVIASVCGSALALFPATGRAQAAASPAPAASVDPHYYDYDAQTPYSVTQTPYGKIQGVAVTRITFPSPVVTPYAANNVVVGFLFHPSATGPHPAMLVLHEWLPTQLKDEFTVCVTLAKANVAALAIEEPYSLDRRPLPHVPAAELLSSNVPQMVAGLRQCVIDSRRALDWLSAQPDIDSRRLGVSGISLGGILAPLVAGVDHRARVVVAIDGGADVADIVWSSPFLRKLQTGLRAQGYTPKSLHTAMAPLESSNWLAGFDPHNAILFNGRYDVFVKPDNARKLSKALGDAPIVWLNTGHYGLALSLKSLNDTGAKFVQSRFADTPAVYTPPTSLPSHTVKFGLLIGGHEELSPDLAYQILNFDAAGRYSLDGQLTLHGLSGALSARLTNTSSIGIELPVFHGATKPKPFLLVHIVL